MHGNDDPPTPNGETPHFVVTGGEIGQRLDALEQSSREVEARLVVLDGKHDAATEARGRLRDELVAKLDAIIAAHQQTLALRAFACVEAVSKQIFTAVSAPIYAVAVVVFAVYLTATTVQWGDLAVAPRANPANASDDAGGDAMGAEPEP